MKTLIEQLEQSNVSCIIRNGAEIREFFKPGVADLRELTQTDPDFLQGADIADKVVGKAAAALMINGGVAKVYARLISLPALALLQKYSVKVEYAQCVEYIINRSKTGICPLEKINLHTDNIQEILDNVEAFIASLNLHGKQGL